MNVIFKDNKRKPIFVLAIFSFLFLTASTILALTPIKLQLTPDTTAIYFEEYFDLFERIQEFDDAKVGNVVDGDTIWATIGTMYTKIRLLGLDTPETVHPTKPVEYFGKQASNFAKKALSDREIKLSYDWDKFDKYERLLAYVWFPVKYENSIEYILYNLLSIINGYGHAYLTYPFKDEYVEIFKKAEDYARENYVGLWSEDEIPVEEETQEIIPEVEEEEDIRIAFINYGDNPEYIKIKNYGNKTVNLACWKIIDEDEKHVYVFSKLNLKPGYVVMLYSGYNAEKNVWTNQFIWNNDGDTGFLYDADGNLVDTYKY